MKHNLYYCLDLKQGLKVFRTQLFLALSLLSFVTACNQASATTPTRTPTPTEIPSFAPGPTPTETPSFVPKPTQTLTATPNKRDGNNTFGQFGAEPLILPSETPLPTVTPKPFLISYTFYQDGGDDLGICLRGVFRPDFILYTDGQLVFLRDGQYWQAFLSQDEITELFVRLSNTDLFLCSEEEYNEGNSVLILNGNKYAAPWNLPALD